MNTYYRIGCSLALILAIIIGSAAPVAAQQQRHQQRREQPSPARHEYIASRESHHQERHQRPSGHSPARHVPVVVKDRTYFFLDGIFYRSGLNGYIAVQAPLGAVIASLPIGSSTVVVGGTGYNVFGGVYYRHVDRGYEVVRKPYMGEAYCSSGNEYKDLDQVTVITRILNVRQGPGMNHPVINKVHREDILKIVGRAPGWLYVYLPCGEFGWVMKEYVNPAGPCAKG